MGSNNYCILRDNEALKFLIEYRMNQKSLETRHLAKAAGVRKGRVASYLKHKHKDGQPSITQQQLLDICNYLDIKVELRSGLK